MEQESFSRVELRSSRQISVTTRKGLMLSPARSSLMIEFDCKSERDGAACPTLAC